jgi:hypothetical protein
MAQSSILGGERAPVQARGRSADLLGPSDSSDSGSDVMGEMPMATDTDGGLVGAITLEADSDSDTAGTGERGSAVPSHERDAADISTDHIETLGDDALDQSLDEADMLEDDEEADDDGEPMSGVNSLEVEPYDDDDDPDVDPQTGTVR